MILKDPRFLGATKRDGEEARVSAALTFLQVAARAAAAVGGEKFERSRGRELELDEILQVQAASNMKSNYLATSFKVSSCGSSHLRASDSMKPAYLKRGQDSVKDNLLRFILWFWNTPSYCYKYLLWFHSLYSDINVTIPGASILKSWKKGTQFANKMENVSLSSTIPVTKVSMADR